MPSSSHSQTMRSDCDLPRWWTVSIGNDSAGAGQKSPESPRPATIRVGCQRAPLRSIVANRPGSFAYWLKMVETKSPANPLFLREEELRQGIELMFYAYRDFTFESDQQLKKYKLGRAHHRALYFIGRHPGQTVGHLLSILKVTKQSISRVLKDLLEQEYVEQKSGPRDRRDRRRRRRRLPQGAARPARSGRAHRGRQAGARGRPLNDLADKQHVLVVDDDTRLRELLKSFLSRNGLRVSTAANAEAARQQLDALDFDLIVLDVMMPGQTGLEFAGELRKESAVPILMLTAMGDPKDRIAGLEKGVDDYLGKPFEPRELLLRIQSVLRRGRAT